MRSRVRAHKNLWATTSFVATVALALGLYWFQPWKLWTDTRVDDTLPVVALEPDPVADITSASVLPSVSAATPSPTSAETSSAAQRRTTARPVPASTLTPTTTPRSLAPPAAGTSSADPVGSPAATPSARPTARLLSRGQLITHEHSTSGTVSVVQQPDGSRVLAISNLDTSDGPDVEVWLTDARVIAGERGWYVFDDGRHHSLGDLRGNQGNLLYKIPDNLDLSTFTSVSLWCARFDVSFGAAPLTRV